VSINKNLTITLNIQEHTDLIDLVEHFQLQSISTVTKTDVIKHLIKQNKIVIEKEEV
jgi:hypothetical protein